MRKIINTLYLISVLSMFIYTLVCSEKASEAAYQALVFCGKVLVPQLFAGTVLAKMLLSMPYVISGLARFGERGCGFTVLVIGLLCGAQTGAVVLNGMYENGCIGKDYAEKALCFSGGASASFVIGFVGVGLKNSALYGVKLLAVQAAVYLLIFALSGGTGSAGGNLLYSRISGENKSLLAERSFDGGTDAISSAAGITVSMCASVVFFSVISAVIVPLFPSVIGGYIYAALEFSGAVANAASDGIIGWAIGFGGICVLFQLISVTRDLSHIRLAISKVCMGVLFAVLTKAVL